MQNNRVALVTGASRGIGKEIAKTLAKEGIYVVINYSGSKEAAEKVLKEIKEAGGDGNIYGCNVSDYDASAEMIKMVVKKQGHLDILINNAGITRDGLLLKMSERDYDDVLSVNLKGTFHTMRHASRQMLKQKGGVIINISSISGIMGNPGQANYSASKAGIIGLTKSAAKELASRNIRINAVAPGFIWTEMTEKLGEAAIKARMEQIPLGRFGTAKEVSNVVKFLVSEDASYITGQVISVDGGML